ncbi:DeoR/GlpR family DNA-binding transcription regulator [Lacticaseibacillus daqingensis]|uniref:DeoR/GlpR family DNA-binding transcription regulator n=1 Tax=Lacticaseibacillus daqingensis TaxID=2486014 RepID=UPI000F76D0B1|nr:DeoR/GlpR family DNA-binding transcription regulator [Lacticaseibacillus daqingensis]
MLKHERQLLIQKLVNQRGAASVNEIGEALSVSPMTVRRDLEVLDTHHALLRVHGGAQSLTMKALPELSRIQKRNLNVSEKDEVAQIAASLIQPGDIVYLGPGTTNELIAAHLLVGDVRMITNSLPVFESFQERADQFQLQLIGGSYRARSGAFIGSLANDVLSHLRTTKAFISVNGVKDNAISNANPEEGQTQRIALDNTAHRYVVADLSKLNKQDFYSFYDLSQVDRLITNPAINRNDVATYSKYTTVMTTA